MDELLDLNEPDPQPDEADLMLLGTSPEEVVLDLEGSSCQQNLTLIRDSPDPAIALKTPDAPRHMNTWSLPRETEEEAYSRKCKLFEAALASLTADCMRFSLNDLKPATFKSDVVTPMFLDFEIIEKPSQVKKMSYLKETQLEEPTQDSTERKPSPKRCLFAPVKEVRKRTAKMQAKQQERLSRVLPADETKRKLDSVFKARAINPQMLYGAPVGLPEAIIKPATKFKEFKLS